MHEVHRVVLLLTTLQDVYTPRNRGPFSVPPWAEALFGNRERAILAARDCDEFPHRSNRDTDFYINDDCITYYAPSIGMSCVVDVKHRKVIG